MKQKTLIKASVIVIAILFFVFFTNNVKAAEGECASLPCFVPAPTIISPLNNSTTTNSNIVITGLTWKTTKVDVYVDGKKLSNVKMVKHEDYYASFAVKLDNNLAAGKHFIYTYATDEKNGWGGVSKESLHTTFTIVNKKIIQYSKPQNLVKPQVNANINNNVYDVIGTSSTTKVINGNDIGGLLNEEPAAKVVETPAVKALENFKNLFNTFLKSNQPNVSVSENEKQQDELKVITSTNEQLGGGTQEINKDEKENDSLNKEKNVNQLDDYQKRVKTNRVVGFIILAGIALISLFWLLLKEPIFNEEKKMEVTSQADEVNNDETEEGSSEQDKLL